MRGTAVDCGVDTADVPQPTVTLVCSEDWALLFTVLPPVCWDVVWVEWVCVPAAPGWTAEFLPVAPVPVGLDRGAFGCFGAVFLEGIPAVPGRGVEASDAPPLGTVLPAEPGWELLGCLGAEVPGCPCGIVLAFGAPGV